MRHGHTWSLARCSASLLALSLPQGAYAPPRGAPSSSGASWFLLSFLTRCSVRCPGYSCRPGRLLEDFLGCRFVFLEVLRGPAAPGSPRTRPPVFLRLWSFPRSVFPPLPQPRPQLSSLLGGTSGALGVLCSRFVFPTGPSRCRPRSRPRYGRRSSRLLASHWPRCPFCRKGQQGWLHPGSVGGGLD